MSTKLLLQHSRIISTALLVVMVLSVLQLCFMPLTSAKPETTAHINMAISPDMADEMDNMAKLDCCLDSVVKAMDTPCPECEDIDSALQVKPSDSINPLFALLYIVIQDQVSQVGKHLFWRNLKEPDILASQTDIYLVNATFLE